VSGLREWIARRLGRIEAPADVAALPVNVAVAALLVEVLRADHQVDAGERRQVVESMGGLLGLDAAATSELFEVADRRLDEAHDLYQFTSEVNRALSIGQKVELIEELWRVARADERIHKYEEHLIRRVAELLHVPHRSFIAAKIRAGGETR
jgi:uncharacterized tellurite resistance protein B-like protein